MFEGVSSYSETVYELKDKCPICGNDTLTIRGVVYLLPHFGKVLIEGVNCSYCGYRDMNIVYLENKVPIKLTYKIVDRVDVEETWLIRSMNAKVYSPDLGFILAPGSAGGSLITTIEGLMHRLIYYAEAMGPLTGDAERRRVEFIESVREVLNGSREFTLVIEDPTGGSIIRPPPGREGRLEVTELKEG